MFREVAIRVLLRGVRASEATFLLIPSITEDDMTNFKRPARRFAGSLRWGLVVSNDFFLIFELYFKQRVKSFIIFDCG